MSEVTVNFFLFRIKPDPSLSLTSTKCSESLNITIKRFINAVVTTNGYFTASTPGLGFVPAAFICQTAAQGHGSPQQRFVWRGRSFYLSSDSSVKYDPLGGTKKPLSNFDSSHCRLAHFFSKGQISKRIVLTGGGAMR